MCYKWNYKFIVQLAKLNVITPYSSICKTMLKVKTQIILV